MQGFPAGRSLGWGLLPEGGKRKWREDPHCPQCVKLWVSAPSWSPLPEKQGWELPLKPGQCEFGRLWNGFTDADAPAFQWTLLGLQACLQAKIAANSWSGSPPCLPPPSLLPLESFWKGSLKLLNVFWVRNFYFSRLNCQRPTEIREREENVRLCVWEITCISLIWWLWLLSQGVKFSEALFIYLGTQRQNTEQMTENMVWG